MIPHAYKCKVMSHGIVLSCENCTTSLMEIFGSTANFGILHAKYLVLPQVSTCADMKL